MTFNDTKNVYLSLTNLFNNDKKRVVITSGQAVVLHKLAVMSKDGDWIVQEDEGDLEYLLSVLEGYGAQYRFGAPLDSRWLRAGWSSHFEFKKNNLITKVDVHRLSGRDYRIKTSNIMTVLDSYQELKRK